MSDRSKELLRSLPSVSTILEHAEVREWLHAAPRSTVLSAVQSAIDEERTAILAGKRIAPASLDDLVAQAEEILVAKSMPSLRPVVNATGIVLHTGLGRAPLCDEAVEAITEGASGYCNLEYDLATGERGHRASHVARLLCELTTAEAATVVNNNAAATLLILHALAKGREVVVSRGQLIEIGGSFRLPDIMAESGAMLREVGTTNRTHLSDYEQAVGPTTAMLLRVHTSNYRVVGFAADVPIDELVKLAHRHHLLAVDDLGSGLLVGPQMVHVAHEPSALHSLQAGADLVCFSGDKLLGGPQCGIVLGKKCCIERLEKSPLMRAFRIDKLTLLALEATLRCYLDPQEATRRIPVWSMLGATTDELAQRASALTARLHKALPDEQFYVCSDVGFAGGGSMPGHELETVVVQWKPRDHSAESIAQALRHAETPVVARIRDDAVCFDLRTLRESDFDDLVDSVYEAVYGADAGADDIPLPVL
ncbi:MAG: L-seryl-tRNA(Sec) selenium transferase [Planctomycetota bacterium]